MLDEPVSDSRSRAWSLIILGLLLLFVMPVIGLILVILGVIALF